MGGFLLCPRSPGESPEAVDDRFARSLEVFSRKALQPGERVVRDRFVAYRFQKAVGEEEHAHVLELENGDFLLSSGTLFYRRQVGRPALERLYADFLAGKSLESGLQGNFALLIWCGSRLHVLRDFCGYHPVYADAGKSILSNSLLAVARAVGKERPSAQEFYEFLLHGFLIGPETFLPGVEILDATRIWQILPSVHASPRKPYQEPLDVSAPLPALVERISSDLLSCFEMLAERFGGTIGTALSGGYDTRLMLALIRRAGAEPRVYVYGSPGSSDVQVALRIGEGEKIPVEHVDKGTYPKVTPDEFAERAGRDIFFFDGLKALGGVDDGVDLTTRYERAAQAPLQLNGAGGEIYREIWNVPNRRIDLVEFLRMRYDAGAYPYCRPGAFDHAAYFRRFAEKVRGILGIDGPSLSRRAAEKLFPFLRNLFAASNNAANNQISYSILPFLETGIVYPSFDIPIRYKYCGRFQAEMIRHLDPALARYDSSYGINFHDPVPRAYRLRRMVERHIPLSVRMIKRRAPVRRRTPRPYFLGEEYLTRLFDFDRLEISEFVDVARIENAEMFSRALSIEYLLSSI